MPLVLDLPLRSAVCTKVRSQQDESRHKGQTTPGIAGTHGVSASQPFKQQQKKSEETAPDAIQSFYPKGGPEPKSCSFYVFPLKIA